LTTSVASRKAKGKAFEKKIAHMIAATFGLTMPDDIRWAVGRETGEDVKLVSPRAVEEVGLSIECKNSKQLSVYRALEQTTTNCNKNKHNLIPALFFRKSERGNTENWVAVPVEHYLELRKKVLDLEKQLYVEGE
jgi:hypothetical protein